MVQKKRCCMVTAHTPIADNVALESPNKSEKSPDKSPKSKEVLVDVY
jgi:hypothetical protein